MAKDIENEILRNSLKYSLFEWRKQSDFNPLNIDKAEGVYLIDHNKNKILDFSSGLINVNIGHGDKRVTDAVVEQMNKVSYVNPSTITQVRGELGKKLSQICPDLDHKPLQEKVMLRGNEGFYVLWVYYDKFLKDWLQNFYHLLN